MVDRSALKAVCHLCGGIKPVARESGIHHSNLLRWLRGEPTLSVEKVDALLARLGLRDETPDDDQVHEWKVSKITADMRKALPLFFPRGAKVAFAPWTVPSPSEIVRMLVSKRPEIYALNDGRAKAVIRAPAGLMLWPERALGRQYELVGSSRKESTLAISPTNQAWLKGPLSIRDFDKAWHWGGAERSIEDLLDTMRELGLSFGAAEQLLRRYSKRQ